MKDYLFDRKIKQRLTENETLPPDDWLNIETDWEDFEAHCLPTIPRTAYLSNWEFQLADKLNNLVSTTPTLAFEAFVQAQQIAAFDTQLQQSLSSLTDSETPDWSDFSQKLTDASFDTQFAEKVNAYEVNLPTQDWTQFESVLQTASFDNHLRNILDTHETPYVSGDWKHMRTLLDGTQKPKVFAPYLWASVGLIALLLGGLAIGKWVNHAPTTPIAAQNPSIVAKPSSPTVTAPVIVAPEKSQAAPLTQTASVQQQPSKHIQSRATVPTQSAIVKPMSDAPVTQPIVSNLTNAISSSTYIPNSEAVVNVSKPVDKVEKWVQTTDKPVISPAQPTQLSPAVATKTEKSAISIRTLSSQHANMAATTLGQNVGNPYFSKPKKPTFKVYLGGVVTGLGTVAELNEVPKYGYNAGLQSDFIFSPKWSVQVQALYGYRQLEHRYYKYSEPLQKWRRHLLQGELASIDIPISVKRTWQINRKWGVYGRLGVMQMLSLTENYLHYDPTRLENLYIEDGNFARMIPTPEKQSFQMYAMNLVMGAGIQYDWQNIRFTGEPTLQLGLQPVSSEQQKLSSFGMSLSVSQRLHRK